MTVLWLNEQLIREITAPISRVKRKRNTLSSSKYILRIWGGRISFVTCKAHCYSSGCIVGVFVSYARKCQIILRPWNAKQWIWVTCINKSLLDFFFFFFLLTLIFFLGQTNAVFIWPHHPREGSISDQIKYTKKKKKINCNICLLYWDYSIYLRNLSLQNTLGPIIKHSLCAWSTVKHSLCAWSIVKCSLCAWCCCKALTVCLVLS